MPLSHLEQTIVFVGGAGRSGTHHLGRILGDHPQTKLRLEKKLTFRPISQSIAHNEFKSRKITLALRYLRLCSKLTSKVVVEKTHPSVWIFDQILDEMPCAKMIAITRSPYEVVASMKKHEGVQRWYDEVDITTSNPFLGITKANKSNFNNLSSIEQFTHKWIAHYKQIQELQNRFPNQVLSIHFDGLIKNTQETYDEVCSFIGLNQKHKLSVQSDESRLLGHRALQGNDAKKVRDVLEQCAVPKSMYK